MQNRILQFIKAEHISQSQLADEIGVARASVSHILAGRNKPGCDFIARMAQHYPTLNLDWLLLGIGNMYKGEGSQHGIMTEDTQKIVETVKINTPAPSTVSESQAESGCQIQSPSPVSKVIVFFSDGTYQELPR